MFNELLVYGGGVLTVLITIIFYRFLIGIPSIDKHMVSPTCVVGGIWLCLLYWYILNQMDIPVWELVFTPLIFIIVYLIIFLIVFFLPFLIILFMLKVLIKMIYIRFSTDYDIWNYDELDDHKFTLCSLFISPLPYLPLLFSFLIPLWNHLFEQ